MDVFGAPKLKKLFKKDAVCHDNNLFKLHHQANYFFVFIGVLFIFGQNYLGNPIKCYKERDGYVEQYCWYHGSAHLPETLSKQVSGCIADQRLFGYEDEGRQKDHEGDQRHTQYYLWLPFTLGLCLAIIKTPRFFWKNLCERGLMESIMDNTLEKIAQKIAELKGNRSFIYFLSFIFCEILNILSIIFCTLTLDTLLEGNFLGYGSRVHEFYSTSEYDRRSFAMTNPMCDVFPTEVSCLITSAGINGELEHKNHLCMLSNNMFNQYYFFVLWVWWIILFSLSLVFLILRVLQLFVPGVAAATLRSQLSSYGLEARGEQLAELKLKQWDYFLLMQIIRNLRKGSKVRELIKEMITLNRKINDRLELN